MVRTEGSCAGGRGMQLHYQSWRGEPGRAGGASVLFVHGIGDHGGRHPHLVEALVSAGHAVLAPDMRGHGLSPGRRGHVDSWDDYHEDLRALIALAASARSGAPLFVIGHSLGGLIVLEYALRFPEGFAGIVAMSPALSLEGVPRWKVAASRVLDRLVPRLSMKVGLDSGGMSRDPAAKDADDEDPLLHSVATVRIGVEVQKALAWTLAHAADLRVPLLVVHGAADTVVPPAGSLAFYERITLADKTRIEYEGGYHELDNDLSRDEVLGDITAWMARHL